MIAPAYRYRFALERPVDGDTFLARVELGFYVSAAIKVRVAGCNCPELRTAEGRRAADFTQVVLGQAKSLVLESLHDRRSFERWVCIVWVDGQDLAEVLIEAGHAVEMKA